MEFIRRFVVVVWIVSLCWISIEAQQRGSYNLAKKTAGERFGDLSPSAIAGLVVGVVAGIGGMCVTVFFCYFVYRQQKQKDSVNNSFQYTSHVRK